MLDSANSHNQRFEACDPGLLFLEQMRCELAAAAGAPRARGGGTRRAGEAKAGTEAMRGELATVRAEVAALKAAAPAAANGQAASSQPTDACRRHGCGCLSVVQHRREHDPKGLWVCAWVARPHGLLQRETRY